MNIETVRKLAASAPPPASKPWKFKDARTAWAEIARLESEIGLPNGPKIMSIGAANKRVVELEKLLASKTPPVVESLPKLATAIISTAEQFMALSPAAQVAFSEQGKSITTEEFSKLPVALRIRHHALGGQLVTGPGSEAAPIMSHKDGRYKKIMRLQAFNKLSFESQSALIKHGVTLSK